MSKSVDDFIEYILYDVLSDVQPITVRKMFGGGTLYLDGVIFGLVTSDAELYFKVDDTNRTLYEELDSHPFIYDGWKNKKRTAVTMPYWHIPAETLEDRERILNLLERSVAIGKRKTRQLKRTEQDI